MKNLQSLLNRLTSDAQKLVVLYLVRVGVASYWDIKDRFDWTVRKARVVCEKLADQDILTQINQDTYTLRRVVM